MEEAYSKGCWDTKYRIIALLEKLQNETDSEYSRYLKATMEFIELDFTENPITVPCPICLSAHCASKEGGRCPEEEDFKKAMNPDREIEEVVKKFGNKFNIAYVKDKGFAFLGAEIQDFIRENLTSLRDKSEARGMSSVGHMYTQARYDNDIKEAEARGREAMREEASNVNASELARWLHENHKLLGPYIWEACCKVYGLGGTAEANYAYKKIALSVKEALTPIRPLPAHLPGSNYSS